MKDFVKTLPGKVILFILCLLFLSGLVLSTAGICLLANHNVYSKTQSYVLNTEEENLLWQIEEEVLWKINYQTDEDQTHRTIDDSSNVLLKITDWSGQVLVCDEGYDELAGCFRINDCGISMSVNTSGDWAFDGWGVGEEYYNEETAPFRAEIALRDGLPAYDQYAAAARLIAAAYQLRYILFIFLAVFILLFLPSYAALLSGSGRRPNQQEIVPGHLDRIPFDLLGVASAACAVLLALAVFSCIWQTAVRVAAFIICTFLFSALFLGLSISAAIRVKQHSLFQRSFLSLVCRSLISGIRGLPTVWRTALLIAAISLLELFVLLLLHYVSLLDTAVLFLTWLLEKFLLIPAVLYLAHMLQRLQKGSMALASGNLSYRIKTDGMSRELKACAEGLNSISSGMSAAVEQKLKSERMKTELITNVSHDLKTPLTSIVNYAGLIEQESCDNPKITEYAGVLFRQSARLKRLIEDLVEASKASTGNIEVNMQPCDAAVLVTQAAGEHEEKLAEAGLTLITEVPDRPVPVLADGRRMWRVFDNLLNNARKYSLPGTRVYITLEVIGAQAIISFKNISRDKLNTAADELKERFVRGDSSRATEGSGLGLSIAGSLTELQGGTLKLSADGDLFKAVLTFPLHAGDTGQQTESGSEKM